MFKSVFLSFALMLMLPFSVIAADATSAPPGVTMSSPGMVPEPPVCNTNTQKLHWNGSGWQCIGVGRASSAAKADNVTGYARGSFVGTATHYYHCPAGSTGRFYLNPNPYQYTYYCFRN